MAKKSKSLVKAESQASREEETIESVPELNIPTPGGGGGIIEFVHLFGGLAILTAIAMIIYLLNLYVFHIL